MHLSSFFDSSERAGYFLHYKIIIYIGLFTFYLILSNYMQKPN